MTRETEFVRLFVFLCSEKFFFASGSAMNEAIGIAAAAL
jgi:hypothetical protein